MAWRWIGDKPLSKPVLTADPFHWCIYWCSTGGRCVNLLALVCWVLFPLQIFINEFCANHFLLRPSSSWNTSFCLSVCPSVSPSVTPFSPCSLHPIIMKFSVITIDRHDVHAKGEGQKSKVKVTEITTPFSRFQTVTPVWNHIWWWNDAQSLMWLRRGALLFFKVIRQISRSHS